MASLNLTELASQNPAWYKHQHRRDMAAFAEPATFIHTHEGGAIPHNHHSGEAYSAEASPVSEWTEEVEFDPLVETLNQRATELVTENRSLKERLEYVEYEWEIAKERIEELEDEVRKLRVTGVGKAW